MFASGPNYDKLKTNLRLSINRLKLLGKKKTEQAQKARKEIADYIGQGKSDRARIRVEHIIREDYFVEALEVVELYCDLLVARFGIIKTYKEVDPGLEESLATLIYCTPRIQSDVPELRVVSDQLTLKYKKEFAEACRANQLGNVNMKVVHRLAATPPPKALVERYLIEIARSHNVPFEPDAKVLQEEEVALAEDQLGQLIDFRGLDEKNPNALPANGVAPDGAMAPAYPPAPGIPFTGPGGGPPYGGGAGGGGPPFSGPGGAGGGPHFGGGSGGGGGGGGGAALPYPPAPMHPTPPGDDHPAFPSSSAHSAGTDPGAGYPPSAPAGGYQNPVHPMPPSYNETMWNDPGTAGPPPLPSKRPAAGGSNSLAPTGKTSDFSLPELPGIPDSLPDIPSPPRSGGVTPHGGGPGGASAPMPPNDDVDLDDLTRRFEELKKRK